MASCLAIVGRRRKTPYVGYVRTLRDRRERSRGDLVPGHASNGKGSGYPDRGRPVHRGVYSPARLRRAAPHPSHNRRGVLRPRGCDAGILRGPNVARGVRIVRVAAAWHPHSYAVDGEATLRSLAITLPAGFERFVAEVGEPAQERTLPPPGEPDIEKLNAAAAKVGI